MTDWERWRGRLVHAVLYVALAASTLLAMLVEPGGAAGALTTLGLAALAAAWMLGMATLRPVVASRSAAAWVYFAGLLVLFGLLLWRSTLFGLFAWTGYLQAGWLPGRGRYIGVTATAFLVAATYIGGFQNLTVRMLPLYAVFGLAGTAIGGGLVLLTSRLGEQNARQREMLDELTEANARLEAALEENAGLHAQLLTQAREAGALDERARMAREIHDTLAQGFTGIVAQLEAALQNPGQWDRYARQAQALARENLTEARRSVQALRPQPLEQALLPQAIGRMSERWAASQGVPISVETTGTPGPLHPDVEVALFRVAQEALTNVAKHASAGRVGLTLSYLDDVVLLDVRDDGVGFVPDGVSGEGFGLSSMRQRMLRVAGGLSVESAPGEGTAVNATAPAVPAGEGTR
ncbi:sensor histidine kinase [Actinomadura rupiterrae]|uniref:sensor histidine kinase n=1 Tax=Actinomadura rupiterrae TaxID=559627 RepID=UPI0020A25C56|nr:sensor histidine kinase [Actinomadura rupiterrae]MCP2343817.1 signal transduction histidine kinase [Actinomadura rupiterrae]